MRKENDDVLKPVIDQLKAEYEKAKSTHYIAKPLAWALYQVWKMPDLGMLKVEDDKDGV